MLTRWIDRDTGYLHARTPIARTGTQVYRDGAREVIEYRDAAEVFAVEAMASFERADVTWDHPDDFVDTDTRAHARIVGHLGSTITRADDLLVADLVITDADAIQAITSGERTQISAGYSADVEYVAGTTASGERYDARQTNIRANHVALVERGRAGPRVAIPQDAAHTDADSAIKDTPMDYTAMTPDELIARIAELEAKLSELDTTPAVTDAPADAPTDAPADAPKTDSAESRIDAIKAEHRERVRLVEQVARILPRVDHVASNDALRRAAVSAIAPTMKDQASKASGEYLRAMLDLAQHHASTARADTLARELSERTDATADAESALLETLTSAFARKIR